ncbi:Ndufb8, NADH dehydrogenase 19kDa subunit [Clavulina sp. PMI_390]|nr:Ndufb8, NADH dehydrogenase 19kDa subunit [Clavulina sp. PMI_390]
MNSLLRSAATRAVVRSSRNTNALCATRQTLLQQRFASSSTTQPVEWEPKEVDPQLQDYPQLPAQSYQRRPAGKWDDPQERRNFGEPLPEEQEVLSVWSYDHYAMSGGEAVKQLSVAVAVFAVVIYGLTTLTPEMPAIRRQYPYSGLVRELGGIEENKAREESIEGDE